MVYEYRASLKRVIDGDTVVLEVDLGFHTKLVQTFRLLGINAPEIRGSGLTPDERARGQLARTFLEDMLENRELIVRTDKDRTGKYGRYLANILVESEESYMDVCLEMINAGLATRTK